MKKNIVVTGGAGFIGSNLVRELYATRPDYNICVLDALTYAGNLENISDLLGTDRVSFKKIDIRDAEAVNELFNSEKIDSVFHLAAESHVDRSIESAGIFVQTNVLGTQNLLEAARRSQVKRFVHVSTDEVYGSLDATELFYEETPLEPTSPYAASKAASDLLALAYYRTYDFDVVITRCTNNYGPYQFPEKFVPLFITNTMEGKSLPLYGDGSNVRSWLHVSDHCKALVAVLEKGKKGSIYNIGPEAEAERSNKEVALEIIKALGKSESLLTLVSDRLAHDFRYAVCIDKIKSELNWKPIVTFAQGMQETIDWYKGNTDWWTKVKSGEYKDYYQRHYAQRCA